MVTLPRVDHYHPVLGLVGILIDTSTKVVMVDYMLISLTSIAKLNSIIAKIYKSSDIDTHAYRYT